MTSFSCPHFMQQQDWCQRLGALCVPGRPGCVIPKSTVFAVPWQQRLEAKRYATATTATTETVPRPTIRGANKAD